VCGPGAGILSDVSSASQDAVRRVFEATNARDVEGLRELYAPEFRLNGATTTFDEFAMGFGQFFAAFPDARGAVDQYVVEGGTVAARWTTEATHLGDYAGAPATGRRVSWHGTTMYRIEGGKVVEMWQTADLLDLMQQIGAVVPARRAAGGGPFRFQVRPSRNGDGDPGGPL
jgi:steroid delta-isomerase-like uncharacterized protein